MFRRSLRVVTILSLTIVGGIHSSTEASAMGRPDRLTLVSQGSDFEERGLNCQPDPLRVSWEKESSIVVNPTDPRHIVVAWLEDDAVGIVTTTTFDGGVTWTQAVPSNITQCTGGEFANVFHPRLYFGPDGELFLLSHPHKRPFPDPEAVINDVVVSRSEDGGVSWLEARTVTNGPVLTDMDTGVVEPDTGAFDVVWSQPEIADPVYVSRTLDGGATWTRSLVRVARPGSIALNRIVALPSGRLMVFSQDVDVVPLILGPLGIPAHVGTSDVVVSISEDHARTWSLIPELVAQEVVAEWPAAAVSPDGVVYLASRTRTETGFAVQLTSSSDGGETWTEPRHAFSYKGGDFDLPELSIAAGAGGLVGISHYLYPGDGSDVAAQIVYSRDGGESWASSQIGEAFDYTTVPDHHTVGGALGYFNEITARPCGFVAAATLGGSLALDGPTDVYLADQRVPGLSQGACSP